jgi:hypothetical protein
VPQTSNRSGKITIGGVIWLVVIAAAVYLAIGFGGVYFRRYLLTDKIDQQLGFAGQISDQSIQQQVRNAVEKMDLPPEASRVRLSRPSARTIQISITSTETVNLGFTTRKIPVSITRRRTY